MLLQRNRFLGGGVLPLGWDPAFNGNLAYSGSHFENLASVSTFSAAGRSKVARTGGKYYFEQRITAPDLAPWVGLLETGTGNTIAPGGTTGGFAWQSNGFIRINNVLVSSAAESWGGGATLCFAVDLDNRLVWTRLSGSAQWNETAGPNPATGVGGVSLAAVTGTTFHVACYFQVSGPGTSQLRASSGSLVNAPPSGFAPFAGY